MYETVHQAIIIQRTPSQCCQFIGLSLIGHDVFICQQFYKFLFFSVLLPAAGLSKTLLRFSLLLRSLNAYSYRNKQDSSISI